MKISLVQDEYYPFYSLVEKEPSFTTPMVEVNELEYLKYQQVMKDFEEVQDWLHNIYHEAHK